MPRSAEKSTAAPCPEAPGRGRSDAVSMTVAVTVAVAAALLAACSAGAEDRGADRAGAAPPSATAPAGPPTSPTATRPTPTTPTPTSPTPAPTTTSPPPRSTEPLVLAVHHTLGTVRITTAVARRIVASRVGSVVRVGASGPELRVAPGTRAVAADPGAVAAVPASRTGPKVRAVVVGGVDPLRRPAAYPLRVAGPPPGPVTTLTVVGDVMLGRRVGTAAAAAGDPTVTLRPMARLLRRADLTVGNLESTLSTAGRARQGGDSFAAPPEVLEGLARAGVDALSLANNHTGDFGDRALLATVEAFSGSGIEAFGAGRDRAAASRPALLRRHGVGFAFIGFNAIGETPPAGAGPGALSVRMPPRTGPLDRADLHRVLDVVRRSHRRADVVVVLPHWGTQYTHVAEPVQRRVGRRLVAAGADLVVGGHPHWVQGLQAVDGAVVAHSLGNFVFDMDFMPQTMEGVALTATFWGSRLKTVELTAYRLGADFAPRPARGAGADRILADVWTNSSGPFRFR